MDVIGVDLGGSKLSAALIKSDGTLEHKEKVDCAKKRGTEVGSLILQQIGRLLNITDNDVSAVGICVPGISNPQTGTVWAPNVPGWDEYPLLEEVQSLVKPHEIGVVVDSDRVCYIAGEAWTGAAKGCSNAVFLAVGTGIGAGIMVDGSFIRGSTGSAGSAGWMAMSRPFMPEYSDCGCLEYYASGHGIARAAKKLLSENHRYNSILCGINPSQITARDVFDAYQQNKNDSVAAELLHNCITLWGMAVADLTSLFNPEMIVLGGGVFGPAAQFLNEIRKESLQWAQPVSSKHVSLVVTALGSDAGLIGAGRLAYMH